MKYLSTLFFLLLISNPPIKWLTNFDEAKIKSKEENKNILIYFSGSDWCKPCIRLKKYVLDTQEFSEFANDKFVFLQADFPRLKRNQLSKIQQQQNENLAEKYNSKGMFPLLVLLDRDGKVIHRLEYQNQSADEFIKLFISIEQD